MTEQIIIKKITLTYPSKESMIRFQHLNKSNAMSIVLSGFSI